jgi:glyoxylase-like metal-dependent hydrolase (beta-lactamase superfamily II)
VLTAPDPPLELRILVVSPWQENCYLLVDPATNAALLIDPGDEAARILEWLAGVRVQAILLTHADEDHVGAVNAVRAALGVRAGLHPADDALAAANGVSADFALNDGAEVRLGAQVIAVAHAPGHTPGSVCLRFGDRAIVGDAVFPGGPGHTDSPEALEQALAGLRRTVFTWPDETRLYPGHGDSTTVGRERAGFEAFLARPRPAGLHGDVTWGTA